MLAEAVIRAWDRLRSTGGSAVEQCGLRDALAAELREALASSSELRAEVAGVLRGVDAVEVALTATIEPAVRESGEQVRAVLIEGLRGLGMQFSEFGWLLEEVNDQITGIAETQAELAAGSRAMLEAQQRTLMQLAMLRQEVRPVRGVGAGAAGLARITGRTADEERAAALEAADVPARAECPYPGLAAFGPRDADRFFGREQLTAVLVTRAAEQLMRPGLLFVLGPSGSGKSSLLRAGLLPAIAAGTLPVRGSPSWPADLMTPGRRPLLELATRIAVLAGIPAGGLLADLRTDPARISAAIRQGLLAHARRRAHFTGPVPELLPTLSGEDALSHPADNVGATAVQAHGSRISPVTPPLRLVLIVDQFEEIFTQCPDEQERQAFIRALCAAAGTAETGVLPGPGGSPPGGPSSRDAPALVVIGVRADFYARCAAHCELLPYLQDHQVLVGPMDQAGLRAAIEGPATQAGLIVDDGLVGVLLADLGRHALPVGQPSRDRAADGAAAFTETGNGQYSTADSSYEAGRLPLLAYALQQTWQHREGRRLTVASYQSTGGIDGAVTRAAETVYANLSLDGKQAAQRLLLRLVNPGERTADTRRRVTMTELTGTTGQAGAPDTPQAATARNVLTHLIQARLLTTDTDNAGSDTVEITHEALLWAWPRLREWLSRDRAGRRVHRDLTDATHAWQA
jgi:hypothetical protein